MRNLSMLLPWQSGWLFQNAVMAINDAGQIAGTGINPSGQTHAFLLTPLSAPRLSVSANQPNGQFRFALESEADRS